MAPITDLLAQGRTLSFEFSAPRDAEGAQRLDRTLARLAALRPSFMSVTYGAGGSSRGPTYEVVDTKLAGSVRAAAVVHHRPGLDGGGAGENVLCRRRAPEFGI